MAKGRVVRPPGATSKPKKKGDECECDPGRSFEHVGRTVGDMVGFGNIGSRVGGAIGKLLGHGDYVIGRNSLMESYGMPLAGPPVPKFSGGKRGVRVIEREYIGDVMSGALVGASTVFTNKSYRLNPTDSSTFPWLSQIAPNFDQWEPNGIVFEYRTTSSEFNGSTQALGVVILATDYDVTDATYTSKAEAENSDYAMSVKAADNAIHGIECDKRERPTPILFTGEPVSSGDRRFHDLGNFQVATQGMSVAGVTLGELWVSYDITFYKKQMSDALELDTDVFGFIAEEASTSDYFGASEASFRAFGARDRSSYVDSNEVFFPVRPVRTRWRLTYFVAGTGGSAIVPGYAWTNATEDNGSIADPPRAFSNTAGSYISLDLYCIVEAGAVAKVTFSSGTFPTGIAYVQTIVMPIPDMPIQPVS